MQAAEALPVLWLSPVPGIRLDLSPAELPAGSVADAVNVDWGRPRGVVRPRMGSIQATVETSGAHFGRPGNPAGNASWDFSAHVLRLTWMPYDGGGRRCAIVRVSAGVARVYNFVHGGAGSGFIGLSEMIAAPLDIAIDEGTSLRPGHTPSMATWRPRSGGLFTLIATGAGNYIAANVIKQQNSTPPAAPTITVTQLAGTRSAATGIIYAAVLRDSFTGAQSLRKQIASTGPFTNKLIRLTIPGTADETTWDRIEIYRTTDGGETLRYVTEVVNPGAGPAEVYDDVLPDDQLSFLGPPTRVGRVPAAKYVLMFKDRALWAVDSIVYYSEPNRPTVVDPAFNYVTVRREDGEDISGLARLYDRVFAFKGHQIYELVEGGGLAPFVVTPVVNEGGIGCVAHLTLTEIEGRLLFFGPQGPAMFDGQAPSLIPGPLMQTAGEGEFYEAAYGPGQPIGFEWTYTNRDVVTESLNISVAIFREANKAPGVDTAVYSLDLSSGQFWIDGQQQTGLAVVLPGQSIKVTFRFTDQMRTEAALYAHSRVSDGVQSHPYVNHGEVVTGRVLGRSMGFNRELQHKFFAIDYYPRREWWLYVASPGSTRIDTKWVLEYDTLGAEGGPVWRREIVSASAAVMCDGFRRRFPDQWQLNVAMYGDYNGCLWLDRWPHGLEREVMRATPLTNAQRLQRGILSRNAGTYRFDSTESASPAWPDNTLRGEQAVFQDEGGELYTMLITGNMASYFVGEFMQGRVPARILNAGSSNLTLAVTAAIGGMEALLELHAAPLGDGVLAAEPRELLLAGAGPAGELEAEVRIGDQPELRSPQGVYRARRQRMTMVPGQGRLVRWPIRGRGFWAALRLSTFKALADWTLARIGLGAHAAGSRK